MSAFTDQGPHGGTPVVLLHAIGTSGVLWDEVARALATKRRVVRVDFRGHGATPPTPGPYTLDGLAGDVLDVMEGLGIARAHVAGVSLGGMVAQALVARAPERVAALMLVDTALAIPTEAMWRERAALVRAHGMAPLAATAIPRWLTTAAPDAVRARMTKILLGTAPEGYAGAAEAIATADLSVTSAAIRAPTLVVVGDADIATTPAMAEILRATIPGATLHTLPGAAHLPMAEHPDAVTGALATFLDGLH